MGCGLTADSQEADGSLRLRRKDDSKKAMQLHGLSRCATGRRHACWAVTGSCSGAAQTRAFASGCGVTDAAFSTLCNNLVVGVSTGFEKKLQLQGVGYKAAVEGTKKLNLALGYSHPVELPIPAGLTVKVDANTAITISGASKYLVGQFAADVREWRKPEPYKGKGIRYLGEVVTLKEGKRK